MHIRTYNIPAPPLLQTYLCPEGHKYESWLFIAVFVAGLQLCVNDEEMCHWFEYERASIQQSLQPFDWTPVIMCDATYEHVRCHQLQPEDDLPSLLANLDSSPGTKALLLINSEKNFFIQQSLLAEDEVPMYPVLVITSESGKALTNILEKNERGAVKVKVDIPTASAQSTGSETAEEGTKLSDSSIKSSIVLQMKASKQPAEQSIPESDRNAEPSKCMYVCM